MASPSFPSEHEPHIAGIEESPGSAPGASAASGCPRARRRPPGVADSAGSRGGARPAAGTWGGAPKDHPIHQSPLGGQGVDGATFLGAFFMSSVWS